MADHNFAGSDFLADPACGYGLHGNLPFEEYLSLRCASKHGLDLVSRSHAHFRASIENPVQPTAAMRFGTLAHEALLEPHLFAQWAIEPQVDKRTKAGKAEYADWLQAHQDAHRRVSRQDHETCLALQAATLAHPAAARLLQHEGGLAEMSAIWRPANYNIPCKARADLVIQEVGWAERGIVADVKTTSDARPEAFAKSVANYRYYVQAAFYVDALSALTGREYDFVIIAVEKSAPYGVGVYYLDDEDVQRGRREYLRDLKKFQWCVSNDLWPGYANVASSLPLPKWARSQHDNAFDESSLDD